MMSQRTYYSEEARQRAEIKMTLLVSFCLALGAGIGTALALLFAPTSGEQTREELYRSLEEQAERGWKASEKAIAGLEHQVNELKKRLRRRQISQESRLTARIFNLGVSSRGAEIQI